jgi:hypothetical protein|tara:strand:+ start:2411 stop:2527 length:117 start_codon:yes stop_codon:yes gene_type:complete
MNRAERRRNKSKKGSQYRGLRKPSSSSFQPRDGADSRK